MERTVGTQKKEKEKKQSTDQLCAFLANPRPLGVLLRLLPPLPARPMNFTRGRRSDRKIGEGRGCSITLAVLFLVNYILSHQ